MAKIKSNPYLKSAGEEHEYEAFHIQELKKCAEDPIYFIRTYCQVQHPIKGSIPFELYPYQEKMLRAYHTNRQNVVLSARQTGKALALDTQIPTPNGWTTMGEIQVGDYILGADGKPTQVTFVTEIMYDRPCYELKVSTGESIIADKEHLWEVVDEYTRKNKILTTGQMLNVPNLVNHKNQARFSIKVTKPVDLPNQFLLVDPYVLGAWLGDGATNASIITNHIDDLFIINEISRYYKISSQQSNYHNDTTQNYYFKQLRSDLKNIGVFGNKHIPLQYLRSSIPQRLSLLQGLMDTDGYINKQTGGCELTLTCKKLADDAVQLINSLGLKCSIKCRKINGVHPHVRWTIWFTPYKTQYPIFRLPRKLEKMKEMPSTTRLNSTLKRSIQSITPIHSVPVRCITVDNIDHLYLVGSGFIPTHNTTTSMAYLLWFASFNFEKTILIASNNEAGAMECIHKIRFMYERLPHWIKPGLADDGWNKHNIGFDNSSRIISTATSENSGRGFAISLLYCLGGDTNITIRNKKTGEILHIPIEEAYNLLDNT